MPRSRINPYTGLPPYKKTDTKVATIQGQTALYYIEDPEGRRISKILTERQLNIAIQHTINAAASASQDEIGEVSQALINYAHKRIEEKP